MFRCPTAGFFVPDPDSTGQYSTATLPDKTTGRGGPAQYTELLNQREEFRRPYS